MKLVLIILIIISSHERAVTMSLSLALGKPALALSFLAIVQSVQGIYTKGVKATTRHVLPPLNPSTTPTPAQLSLEAYAHCLHWGCHCQRCLSPSALQLPCGMDLCPQVLKLVSASLLFKFCARLAGNLLIGAFQLLL